ncbi:MAG: DUF3179 domain-containing protein [Acidimicrobiia bacterium]|nr:DUF3179 domain-containing protein [Acidimicrobiia bacterium]MYC57247.1 DUF3179 domain-containing protein [Acidimicrobiia bacterium]MYG94451.1 DUF3179 domain-containing protein [Acidimicrobiia bacterium]MYI30963.1 DUF3179 domain-containing protein [Acidimicrobiia bacterium]
MVSNLYVLSARIFSIVNLGVVVVASIVLSACSTATPSPQVTAFEQVTPSDDGPVGRLAEVTQGWATDFSSRIIDLDELIVGIQAIPIRDRISPIDNPRFVPASQASWAETEPGLVLVLGDVARFYPLAMLIVHEIVNDEVEGRPVTVTYCPLCNSALVFDPVVDGQTLRFGTSGLLRNSDLVMWDDATESLWQQIGGEALVGAFAGHRLGVIPSAIVSWGDFTATYAEGTVLAPSGRTQSSYGANPYVFYSSRNVPYSGFFDVSQLDERYPALERMVGVSVNGIAKGYPFSTVQAAGTINDMVSDVPVVVWWSSGTADALDAAETADGKDIGAALAFDRRVYGTVLKFTVLREGRFSDDRTGSVWNLLGHAISGDLAGARLQKVVHTNEFWFAWSAFNPQAEVYTP